MNTSSFKRVGYWWSEKKSRKINANELREVCRQSQLELVKLDLDRPLDEQGPFVAIVHKLSDFLARAQGGEPHADSICNAVKKYSDSHPEVIFFDPLTNVDRILNRFDQYLLVKESELSQEGDIFIPTTIELTSMDTLENIAQMKSAGIHFPVVCKPLMGHGYPRSHQMCLIFNERGLNDIILPCVVQTFINHNAILYKLFVLGDEYFVIERPSLKNFSAGDQKTIFFDSNNISKPHSASELTELDNKEPCIPVIWPAKEKMDKIVQILHQTLKLNLMGIDVVVDNDTGHYAIVDINIFPGYLEAPNFYNLLTNMMTREIHLRESNREPYRARLLEYLSTPTITIGKHCSGPIRIKEDSGIDTSDSCDEKKEKHRSRKFLHSKTMQ